MVNDLDKVLNLQATVAIASRGREALRELMKKRFTVGFSINYFFALESLEKAFRDSELGLQDDLWFCRDLFRDLWDAVKNHAAHEARVANRDAMASSFAARAFKVQESPDVARLVEALLAGEQTPTFEVFVAKLGELKMIFHDPMVPVYRAAIEKKGL